MISDIVQIVIKKASAFRQGQLTKGAEESTLRREEAIKAEVVRIKQEFEKENREARDQR